MTALLRFEGVALVRGGRLLFDQLDLAIRPGERLQLTGPNGTGKSSLIRLAAGLLRPAAGRIDRSALALADDALALDRDQPLRRALAFWAGLAGGADRLRDNLDALGLTALADVPVRLLSTGQAKRAALARVASSAAPLWLLDEPVNGLDRDGVERLMSLIDRHVAGGGAVLAASHVPLGTGWPTLELGR